MDDSKLKGILFKPAMIAAIQEGQKTQTLRIIKELKEPDRWVVGGWDNGYKAFVFYKEIKVGNIERQIVKPPYRVGETVYIKEAWATSKRLDFLKPSEIGTAASFPLWYAFADKPTEEGEPERGRWRSPMFMPEWAARSFILILDVRPQLFRFNDMTAEELELEGGEAAVELLKGRCDRKWVWHILFEKERPEEIDGAIETRRSLAEGKGITFPNAEEAIKWLKMKGTE